MKSDRVHGGCHTVIGVRPPSPVVPGVAGDVSDGLLTPR